MMNNYFLFAGEGYYPSGGIGDFLFASTNLDEVRRCGLEYVQSDPKYLWAHIAIFENNRFVKVCECGCQLGLTAKEFRWFEQSEIEIHEKDFAESAERMRILTENSVDYGDNA